MTAANFQNVAAFILAGGSSSRMGADKALLEWNGEPLLLLAARLLDPLVASVTVIGEPARYAALGLTVVPDDVPNLGPLGGIATALRISRLPWNLVVGCDLPYLTAAWLEFLISRALASRGDVLLPEGPRGPEPLCAVYHARCAPVISTALQRGVRKVTDGLAGLVIETLPHQDWKAFDSDGCLFKNMNSPADYEWARARLKGKLPK